MGVQVGSGFKEPTWPKVLGAPWVLLDPRKECLLLQSPTQQLSEPEVGGCQVLIHLY